MNPSDEPAGSGGSSSAPPKWWLYRGTGQPLELAERDRRWPPPPPWRTFPATADLPIPPLDEAETRRRIGGESVAHSTDPQAVAMVNAAIYLRRPVIVTGRPGSGKSALAHMISRELGLGRVLRWPITSRTTLHSGLYEYDAFGRAQAVGSNANTDIGNFVHLGALGTALLPHRLPRVLLVDELDKSDIDLPNDLLSVFEEGEFAIKELVRVRDRQPEVMVHAADPGVKAPIRDGIVRCRAFPIIVITSNGEREFPPALLRRCLTLEIPDPDINRLAQMVAAHFQNDTDGVVPALVRRFVAARAEKGGLAADQLLNAVHLVTAGAIDPQDTEDWPELLDAIWHRLSGGTV
ncbi:MAG TPA: MoxR family ATPase [Pseudonocardiaceae bacterium]